MNSFLHWGAATWLVVDALAVYRLTRLVVRDELLRPFRTWMDRRYESGWLLYWLTCVWCLSAAIAAPVVALTYFVPYPWSFVAAGLAFSAVAGAAGDRVG
jgi:hypothetical protein